MDGVEDPLKAELSYVRRTSSWPAVVFPPATTVSRFCDGDHVAIADALVKQLLEPLPPAQMMSDCFHWPEVMIVPRP
jgi:hypothetical protein